MVGRWRVFVAAVCVTLGACDQPGSPGRLQPDIAAKPVVAPGTYPESEPIALDRVVVTIRPGTEIGSGRKGCALCSPTPVHWEAGRVDLRPQSFATQFYDTMTAVGYRVAGDPNRLFDERSELAGARFLVGARVTDLSVNLDQIDWAFSGPSSKGDAEMAVAWQVYSLRERRVVYEKTTAGRSTIHRSGFQGALTSLIHDAFADALLKLGTDRNFRSAVTSSSGNVVPASLAATDSPPLEVPRFRPFTGPATARLTELRGSAVTIVFERGHGSGFFISDDGLILTNQHVVGDAEAVNVRLLGGVEVVGRVLRRHAARDVALVKVELQRTRPLPLRRDLVRVGEEVYALGAPRDAEFAGSVTRGIVSAIRRELRGGVELGMIQSDAAIQGGNSGGPLLDGSGNVVGIAVEGYGPRGQYNAGLNFFIPIDEALQNLNIRLGEARELRF